MASKAGRAQFKDIKAGKVLWVVRAGRGKAMIEAERTSHSLVWMHAPERVVVTARPFRSMVDKSASAIAVLKPDWTFKARADFGSGFMEELYHDCSDWGIVTDVTPKVGLSFMFVTQKAANRYYEFLKNADVEHMFEHPRQWESTGLRKRVSTLYNGKRAVYGDIPTRTNSHRPWLHLRPTEFLMGGMVMNQDTPESTREHFRRESAKELSLMYPHTIVPISDMHAGMPDSIDAARRAMENFFKGFWEQFPTPEAQKAHIHDDGVKHLYPRLDHAGKLPPGAVFVPSDLSPEDRALLEKDFVILDEAHMPLGHRAELLEQTQVKLKEAKEKRSIVSIDPAGPTLAKVVIGNGRKIHSEWYCDPAKDVPLEPPSPEVLAFADQILDGTKITAQGSFEKLKFDDPGVKKEE